MKSRLTLPLLVVLTIAAFNLWLQGAVPDVPTGQWMAGPAVAQPREGAVSVALEDGRVLLIGGRAAGGPVATVEVANEDGSISLAPPMALARVGHTAVRLPDGSVLVAGGTTLVATEQGTAEVATASAEIFAPAANVWSSANPLNAARTGHTATALADGRVLVAGGTGEQGALDSMEVFEPLEVAFRVAGLLSAARAEHAAALAGKTQVVVVGGRNADGVLNTADLIDVDTGSVAQISLTASRAGASATTLLDGTVLVAGGTDGTNELASAEIIDGASGTTTGVASMAQPRRDHQAIRLDRNNTVLIVGGTSNGAVVTTAEQYVPWTEQFLVTGSPAAARTATALSNSSTEGVALLAAGKAGNGAPVAATELYGFATVKTDKGDYPPGEFVTITGSGWQPGETVNLVLHEVNTGAPDMPLIATADAQGNIFNDVFAPNEQDDGVRFYLTATGAGSTAQMTFTDAKPNAITVGLQSPSPIAPGGSSTFAITVGFNGNAVSCTASLSVTTVLPSGAVASFSPSSVTSTGANQTSTLTITTTGATPPGLTSFTVRAAGTSPACNTDIATGSGSLLVVEPTTTTLGSAPNPSTFGQSVTLTATVTQTVGSTTPNAGNVTFKDGATTLGLVAVNASGVATLSTSALTVAGNPHSLTASYAGATAFGASSSNTVSQVVNQSSTTTAVARTAGPNPSAFGQSLTFTATVTPVAPGGGTRTGTVTFMDGVATIGTGAVNASGLATLTTTMLAVGAHSISAVYGGDSNFTTSTSSALSHTVNQAGTTTTITSDLPEPSVVGQPVSVNFTVVSGGGTPTGNVTVTVNDASGNTCSGTVAAGTCSLILTTAGSKTLTATYAGDTNFTGSASTGTPHAVDKANTTTTITGDLPDPSLVGESVTVNYTVIATAPGAGTPAGNVTVSAGVDNCTGTVAAGTCDITFASSGAKTLTANFPGDLNYNTSTSAGVVHTVNQAPSISSANSTTFTVGTAGSFTVTATGFPAPTFSQTGALPSGVTFDTTTGVLSGIPGPNTGGAYPVTITASNGVLPNATQNFTLTVNQAPAITSANSTSFVVNTAGSFAVTATGFPVPTLGQSGPLPAGVTFTPGTGLLSGTPTVSGSFPITFTASNGVGSNATQSFTLTVGQPPTITSADNTSFTVNTAGSFTVTATGFPAPTFTKTGTLPTGVTLSSAGVLSGTPPFGTVGTYPIAITAANGVGSNATQNFTLTVNKGTVTFNSLSASSVITYGTPTISVSGRIDGATMLPGTVTVTVNGVSAGPLSLGGNPNNFSGTLNTAAVPASAVPYTITYTYSGDANFNVTTDTSTSLTVNKATPAVAVSFGASPIPYDGASHAATVTVTGVSGPLTVPANGTTAITYLKSGSPSGTPTDAGSYTASATFTSTNPNYNDASSTVNATLTINKATPTVAVSFGASPIPYDGASHAATVTVTGVSGPLTVPGDGTTAITYLKSGSPSGTPTNAGSYTASATYTSTNPNYNNASSTVNATLTINKATPTVAVSFGASPIPYDGASHAATVTVTGVSGPLTVPGDGTTAITYLKSGSPSGTPTNAGSYTASATYTSTNPNYNNASSTVNATLTINKATPTVAVSFATSPIPYDGASHAATVTVTGVSGPLTVPGDGTTAITYLKSASPSGTPTDAGSYTASATFTATNLNYNDASSTVSAALTINKASSTTVVTFADGPTTLYTGDPHPATATVTGAGGLNDAVPVTYTPGPGAPVNAGSYSADASFAGDTNHDPSTGSAALTITKVDPTVTATGNTCTYDGNPCAGSGTATGVKGESLTPVTVAYKDSVGTLLTSAPVNAGTYAVAARFAGDTNYNGKQSASAALTINKASSTTTVTFADGPTTLYTGDPHPATATVTGAGGLNDAVSVTYTPGPGAPVNAGSYSADASFAGDTNHDPSTGSAALTITKVDPTVTATGNTCTYDGNPCAGSGTATGVKGESLTPVTVAYKDSVGTLLTSAPVNAGTYAVAARFAGDTNYNGKQSASAALTINKASSTTTVTFADGPTTLYTGDPHPATATVTGAGGLNDAVAVTYTPGPGAPVNAGSYAADASFAGDANHDPSTGSAALTITKVDPTVTATGNTCTYDGNPCAGSGTATGVKGESLTPVTVAYKDSVGTLLTSAPVNAGTYAVAARFAGDTNYNGKQSASAALTINKASSTTVVTFADGPTTLYTGDPHPATATVTGAGGLNDAVAVTYTPGPGAPVNAGSYSADASFAGDANHDPSTGSAALTITKVDPTMTATGNTCTYDGNPCAGSGTAAGVKGESLTPVTVAYKDSVGTLLTSAPVNAGTYAVAARFAGDTNYNGKQSASAALTINKASSTTIVTFADGPTTGYTGDPHPATATVTGAGGLNDAVAVTYTPGPGAPVNAGSYAADASFAGDANHDPSTGSAALTITKVDPTVTATGNTCTYDGNPCAGSGTATGVKGESLTPVTVAYKDSVGTLLTSAPVNAGTYAVAARFAGDTNYNGKQSASAALTINKASSTTVVTFADGPTTLYTGDPHPATATVTGAGGLNDAVAVTYTPGPGAPVNAGSYSADASFAGDANHEASSGSASLTIAKADTTTTITSDTPDPSVPGQSVTISYAVAPIAPGAGTPTGNITVNSGGDSCTATVAAGQCSITFTTAGPHPLTASYAGDSNFNGSTSASEPHTVNKANTTAAITSDTPDPSVVGQGVVVNFNVTVNAPGAGSPTGNVTVSDGTNSCIGTAAAGTCTITFTNAGAKSLTATYAGDSNFNGSASSPVTPHQVNKADTTAAITSDAPDPSVVGEIVTIKYNVAVTAPGAGTPAGNVTVSDGTQSCTGTVAAGQCTIAFSTAAAHPVTATYAGDANFNGSVSAAEPHQVNKANTTSTVTSDTPDPSVTGQPVTISYTVAVNSPGAGTATGNVTVSDGTLSCTDTVAAGSCSITFTSAGPRALVATYAGDSNFNGSTSVSAAHAVNKANTQTPVASSPNPSLLNQPVTFTATVTAVAPGAGTRTGTVTFKDGATTIGTGAVSASGQATLTTSSLAAGSHTITAIYGGDANFNSSTGTTSAPQVVNYTFTGFFSPVDNMPTVNSAKAGSAIPTKWRIVDTTGVGVSDPGSFISFTSYAVSCGAWATAITDPVPEDFSGGSGLLYQGNGNWQWNWKTPKEYAGQCRVARVTLSDGTTHEYDVKFK